MLSKLLGVFAGAVFFRGSDAGFGVHRPAVAHFGCF